MIDTHAHLTDEQLIGRADEIVANFKADGIEKVFTVGTSMQTSIDALNLAQKYNNLYAIIGVHPDDIDTYNGNQLEALAKSSNKVIGIGEIGLDYHYRDDNKDAQKAVFISQLNLANKLHLPVIIHSRDATGATLEILKNNKHLLNNGGIWHCFNESYEVLCEIKKLGFIVSLGGVTTFKNARNSTQLIEKMALDDFVLETDCPYLTPEPFRGKAINEPKYVKYTAQHIADVKQTSINNIIEATNKNVYKLFKKLGEN